MTSDYIQTYSGEILNFLDKNRGVWGVFWKAVLVSTKNFFVSLLRLFNCSILQWKSVFQQFQPKLALKFSFHFSYSLQSPKKPLKRERKRVRGRQSAKNSPTPGHAITHFQQMDYEPFKSKLFIRNCLDKIIFSFEWMPKD